MKFYLTHFYPQEMNIYGDMGNIIALTHRLNKMGYEVIYQTLNQDSELPTQTDFYFIGGGQDKEQEIIYQNLLKHKIKLEEDIRRGVGLLAICGGYQLLGKYFITGNNTKVEGLDIFPVSTQALSNDVKTRCVGNLIIECNIPDLLGTKLVGFENHGGQTYFIEDSKRTSFQQSAYALGKVLQGFVNNSIEKIEGCVLNNAVGTYLHGSCLPKNPQLADWLIYKSLWAKAELENWLQEAKEQIFVSKGGTYFTNYVDQVNIASVTNAQLAKNVDDTISLAVQKSLVDRFLD